VPFNAKKAITDFMHLGIGVVNFGKQTKTRIFRPAPSE
jgi:hypothetical protein